MLSNIPAELRLLKQWVCSGPSKLPLNPRTGQAADVTDATTWGTFEEACRSGYQHVGFVLSEGDPYAIIDLDNKVESPASEDEWARHVKILNAFDSYTERSTSGRGYHIVVRGSIPSGVHRDKVEVYSSKRWMICTGDVVRQSPIQDYQQLLDLLYGEMHPTESAELVDRQGYMDDREVVEMAMNAANSEKFNALCSGDMGGYPSQSEADFALLSIFAFYTPDNEQVRRLFRMTALGKREKAIKNDVYIDRCLGKIRAKQAPPVDMAQIAANVEAMLKSEEVKKEAKVSESTGKQEKVSESVERMPGVELPPGLIGELAQYFFATAVRPVPEIALAAALAIVAGVVGRSYNISGSGLNQYLVLLAKTGAGKEGALSGIENLITAVRPKVPIADQFLGPAAFASGQALIKVLNDRPCFVSVLGEFGLTLQQLSDHGANSAQVMLRRVLLDLYAKSGWNRTLRSSVYSDVEKNTKIIQAPNVTILGESTPETFYDGLDASHISEGLIPRFSIIEYLGERPARNRNANCPPPPELVQKFADLIVVALTTTNNNTCCPVQVDPAALVLLDQFDAECDTFINGSQQEVESQLWNRAHLKALKLSALLAVGINPHQPIIDPLCAHWAISFVRGDINRITKRFRTNDVGQGDGKQTLDIRRVIEGYFKQVPDYFKKREDWAKLHKERLIPFAFLAQKTANLASFKNDRLGSTHALRRAVQNLIDTGALIEIPKVTLKAQHGYLGLCYAISNW